MTCTLIRAREPVGIVKQGENEAIAYGFDFTINGVPETPTCKLIIESTEVDISLTNLTGTVSIVGNTVVTPKVHGLTRKIKYRLSVLVQFQGDTTNSEFEEYAFIFGDK